MRSIITIIALSALLSACGGSDKPDDDWQAPEVTAATYTQAAPAGSLTIGVGQAKASAPVVSVSHRTDRPSIVEVTISATNVRTVADPTAAGLRWSISVNGSEVASGDASGQGSTTQTLEVSGGAAIVASITAQVESAGAAGVQWDGAAVSLGVSKR